MIQKINFNNNKIKETSSESFKKLNDEAKEKRKMNLVSKNLSQELQMKNYWKKQNKLKKLLFKNA